MIQDVRSYFNWGDGSNSGWLPTGTTSASHPWTAANTYPVTAQARSAPNPSVVSGVSNAFAVTMQAETVSTPTPPTGTASGSAGTPYTYSTGGSTSSFGNSVQYIFNWGDGSNSGWLGVGVTSASHAWSATGPAFSVTAEARSAANTSVVSGTSGGLSVAMSDPLPTLLSLSPASGIGYGAVFTESVSDYGGTSNLQIVQYWMYSSAGNCHAAYYPSVNQIYLDDAAANYYWVGSGTPGSSTVLSNGACTLYLSGSSVSTDGNTMRVSFDLYLSFATTYNSYLSATNSTGTAGWSYFGIWSEPGYASYYMSGSSFTVGQEFTIWLYTNMPNTSFAICWIGLNNQGNGCSDGYGVTDSNGNWTLTGYFGTGNVGAWEEYASFPGDTTSSYIDFTVTN